MKNKITIFLILLCFLSISCGDRNIKAESDLIKCKSDVMIDSDHVSYIKLTNYYERDDNYYEILPYSLKMMEEAKTGYDDFFTTYLKIKFANEFDRDNILKLEKPERDFLLYILHEGALADDISCKDVLIDYYKRGVGVEKNMFKSDSIYKSAGYSR